MAEATELLRDEEWRDALAANFNGLIPAWPPNGDPADTAGWLTAARLSNVSAFHVAGSSQVLRRSSVTPQFKQRHTDAWLIGAIPPPPLRPHQRRPLPR